MIVQTAKYVLLSCVFCGIAPQAFASQPAAIMGTWIRSFPNGKGMVTEFSPNAINSYPVDETGKIAGPQMKLPTTYKDGDGNVVLVSSSDGKPFLMVMSVDKNHIKMDFPGQAAFDLTRLQSK